MTSFNSSSKAKNCAKMSTFGDLQKRKGTTTKPLFLFFSSLFVVFAYLTHFFFCFVVIVVCGVRDPVFRGLNGLPQVVSAGHIILFGHGALSVVSHSQVFCLYWVNVWSIYEPGSSAYWIGF